MSESEAELRPIYGDDAVFTEIGNFTLVHLGSPDAATIAKRVREFDPAKYFVDDCPLCARELAKGGHVVFERDGREGPLDLRYFNHVNGGVPYEALPYRFGGAADRRFDAKVDEEYMRFKEGD